jgi:hypothetical protein
MQEIEKLCALIQEKPISSAQFSPGFLDLQGDGGIEINVNFNVNPI